MRLSSRNRCRTAASLGLAGWAALAGSNACALMGPPATFTVSIYSQLGVAYGGGVYDVYVFTATNDAKGTDTGLLGEETVIDSGGPSTFNSPVGALAIDVENVHTINGASPKYYANVDGDAVMSHGVNAGGPAAYGDPASGTFVGVGWDGVALGDPALYNPDYSDYPVFSTGTQFSDVFVQHNTLTNTNGIPPVPKANYIGTIGQLDPAFTSSGGTVNFGNINNGTVHSLDVVSFTESAVENPVATPDFGVVPFAQVVVAPGTTFTITSQLAATEGLAYSYHTVITAGSPAPGPVIAFGSSPGGANIIGTASLSTSSGTPLNIAVDGPARTNGGLLVNRSNPANVYGLQVVGANSTSQFISDLNIAIQASNPGAIVEAPTGSAASVLASFGDNIEIVLPDVSIAASSATLGGFAINPTSADASPTYFSYDLSAYTDNGTVAITQITVLPEPAGFGAIILCGSALLSRRRRQPPVNLVGSAATD